MKPNVIYEDNHIIVVIKPHNIAVQADESGDVDMLTIIKDFIKERDNKPGNVFLGLVHRLDRPTGGVMVFAKTSKSASRLGEQLKSKKLKKKYIAVVNGRPQLEQDRLVTYLKKDAKTNTVKIAPKLEEGSKEAILEYELIETKNKLTLVDVNLITGRSHQIRVQMSSQLNCPIYGDFKYGDKSHGGALALWAYQLEFVHPTTKENMKFKVAPDYENPAFKNFETSIDKLIN
ncbi:MAG: RNA pseudouridine synthase [Clostridiales bacterium]|nr:RNA pseudouridine synthase [Clostridiales bacterium]